MIIIGCDPDSKAHGIAIFEDGILTVLKSMPLMEFISNLPIQDCEVHVEDVAGQKGTWHGKGGVKSHAQTGKNIGKCQQAQIELERAAEFYGHKVVRHKVSSMWKGQPGKVQFEQVTGWTGRSNEDTRSAAWFGYLGVTMKR